MLKKYMIMLLICVSAVLICHGSNACGTFKEAGSCPSYNALYNAIVKDPVKTLLEVRNWYLSASSSTAKDAPPPKKSCVNVTVTDTGNESICIFNTFNHTEHRVKVIKIVGYDEEGHREFFTIGPIHEYPVRFPDGSQYDQYQTPPHFLNKHFLHFDSMIKSTTCWNAKTLKFDPYRFIVKNPFLWIPSYKTWRHESQYLHLVGIKAKMPRSEIHTAVLGERKMSMYDINEAIWGIHEFQNCKWPIHFPFGYMDFLLRPKIRCATDYDPKNSYISAPVASEEY